jgi:RNA polymerase sigma-70 factor (ECF subfamily)
MPELNRQQSNEEDFEAIRKILDGDKSAFTFIQNKYKTRIKSLVRRMIKDPDDVDDLTQEAFIKAYNALDSFQFAYNFSAWLYRIASNSCIDFLRKKRFKTVSIDQPVAGEEDLYIDIPNDDLTPDIEMISKERKKILKKAIDELPENYRNIINMRHTEEMDYKEIAEKLEIPLGTVKAHLFRARKLLYDALIDKKEIIRYLND